MEKSTANNPANVSAGKGVKGGYIFSAPVGTTLPVKVVKNKSELDEAFEWAMENRLHVHHWFFSTDLSSYVRGGRVSRVSGFVGTALKICPVLNMNDEGKLIPRDKIRTKAKAAKDMVARMEEHVQDGHDYAGKCSLSMSACREDAEAVRDMVEAKFPALAGKVQINDIGTVIGSHTGPGTVALFFMGDERPAMD